MEWLESLGVLGLFLGSMLASSIVPLSSDVLLVSILAAGGHPLHCYLAATFGSWIGSSFTFWLGWLGKWEWIEKWFKVTPEKLEQQQEKVHKYGLWLALFSWIPLVGDISILALGFYKSPPALTEFLILVGKAVRYLFWILVMGWL